MDSLFLVFSSFDYEGSQLLSAHRTPEQALLEADRLMNDEKAIESFEVRAIAPGTGRGITLCRWRGEWCKTVVEEDGPPEFSGEVSYSETYERIWKRLF